MQQNCTVRGRRKREPRVGAGCKAQPAGQRQSERIAWRDLVEPVPGKHRQQQQAADAEAQRRQVPRLQRRREAGPRNQREAGEQRDRKSAVQQSSGAELTLVR
jgi:hypothetical protein